MTRVVVRRVLAAVPVLLVVSLVVFALVLLVPGDPAVTLAGEGASEAQIDATRERLGLDEPVLQQYTSWAANLLRGDLGDSLFTSRPVADSILERLPTTLSLGVGALIFAVGIGVPAGAAAALRRGTWIDRAVEIFVASALAMPAYFFGMLMLLGFAVWNHLLPSTGFVPLTENPTEWAKHLILPWITLALTPAAVVARQLRSSLIGVLDQDYVRTAKAKGLGPRSVVAKHSMKNAAIPAATALGTQAAALLGGSVVVEQVFGITGIGTLAIGAARSRDLPVIQGVVVATTLMVVVVNLLVDFFYVYLNPKVRVG